MSVKQHAQFDKVQEFVALEEQFFEMAERVADRMQALLAEEETRRDLLNLVPEDPKLFLEFVRHDLKRDLIRIVKVLEFLAAPSCRTLRNALKDGPFPPGFVDEQLRAHWEATFSHHSGVPDPTESREYRRNQRQVLAAVMYEHTDLTASKIAQYVGLRRSQVYTGVEWYRGLPGLERDSLAAAVLKAEFPGAWQLSLTTRPMPVVKTKACTVAT